jgi:L-lactate dehydrogenase (cytochrome)
MIGPKGSMPMAIAPTGRTGMQRDDGEILAAKTGADAIIVSNHGGRQLDGASSTINILPEIVDKVGKLIEVHIDGGIRSGQDVVKAMCLGAKGTYIGRAFLYGLGALGKEGVTKALEIIKTEADMTMALCGRRDVHDLNRDNIYTQK